jgi:hypothetical protein
MLRSPGQRWAEPPPRPDTSSEHFLCESFCPDAQFLPARGAGRYWGEVVVVLPLPMSALPRKTTSSDEATGLVMTTRLKPGLLSGQVGECDIESRHSDSGESCITLNSAMLVGR